MSLEDCRCLQETVRRMYSIGKTACIDDFCALNNKVVELTERLFSVEGESADEEAEILVSLFMGYGGGVNGENKEVDDRKQVLLDRAYKIVESLDASLLMCNLLLHCYAEVGEGKLKEEAKGIIISWGGRELTPDEIEAMEFYNSLVAIYN